MDEIIDGYFPVVERFEDRIEKAEDDLLGDDADDLHASLADTFRIKRELLGFRRAVAPLRDVLGRVVRIDEAVLGEDLDAEFRDLYDHALRVYEELDTQRDLLTGIYRSSSDLPVKRAVLNSLFMQRNARALVDLARAEKDPQLKKDIVSKLSVMKAPEATDYLLELLK